MEKSPTSLSRPAESQHGPEARLMSQPVTVSELIQQMKVVLTVTL